MQPWPGTYEHERLLAGGNAIVQQVLESEDRLLHGDTHHLIHSEHARRAQELGVTIGSAIHLAIQDRYAPAFALLRVALEHQMVDSLVMLGRHYVQRYRNVSDATWADWQSRRAAGDAGLADIVEWRRTKKGAVRIGR